MRPSTRCGPPRGCEAGEFFRGDPAIVRALGIDLGSRRIGVAVSDTSGRLATPIEVVQRHGDPRRAGKRHQDHQALGRLAAEWEAEILVVGLPLSLDGGIGPAAAKVLAERDEIEATVGLPTVTWDERLTTVTAERVLTEQGVDSRRRRQMVDMVAASVILQAWLDAGCPIPGPGDTPGADTAPGGASS